GRAAPAARPRRAGLERPGSRRLAAPGRSAQPGAGAQPVPPPPGALAGAGPGPLSGGKRLSGAGGPGLRVPPHAPQAAPAGRGRATQQKLRMRRRATAGQGPQMAAERALAATEPFLPSAEISTEISDLQNQGSASQ